MSGPIDIKGVVAVIIAATFGILLVSTVVGAIATGRSLSPEAINMMSTICGALIGVLSAYIGGKASEPPEK